MSGTARPRRASGAASLRSTGRAGVVRGQVALRHGLAVERADIGRVVGELCIGSRQGFLEFSGLQQLLQSHRALRHRSSLPNAPVRRSTGLSLPYNSYETRTPQVRGRFVVTRKSVSRELMNNSARSSVRFSPNNSTVQLSAEIPSAPSSVS